MQEEQTKTNIVLHPRLPATTNFSHFLQKSLQWIYAKMWVVFLVTVLSFFLAVLYNEFTPPLYQSTLNLKLQFNHPLQELPQSEQILKNEMSWRTEIMEQFLAETSFYEKLLNQKVQNVLKQENSNETQQNVVQRIKKGLTYIYDPQEGTLNITLQDPNPFFAQSILKNIPTTLKKELQKQNFAKGKSSSQTNIALQDFKTDLLTAKATQQYTILSSNENMITHTPGNQKPIVMDEESIFSKLEQLKEKKKLLSQNWQQTQQDQKTVENNLNAIQKALKAPSYKNLTRLNDKKPLHFYQRLNHHSSEYQRAQKKYDLLPSDEKKFKSQIQSFRSQLIVSLKNLQKDLTLQNAELSKKSHSIQEQKQNILKKIRNLEMQLAQLKESKALLQTPTQVEEQKLATPQISLEKQQAYKNLLNQFLDNEQNHIHLKGFHILKPARLYETPISPHKNRNLIFALVFGILFGCFLASVIGFQDEKISSAEDIENEFHVPVLGLMPLIKE